MVQFNLLPDVKQQYIKAVYRRRLISLACILVSGGFLLIFVLLFLFVKVNQARHLTHLDNDIKKGVSSLRSNNDLDKILTVQNQLASLPALHEKKVMTSRLFEYLAQITPNQASVTDVELDVVNKKIILKGTADNIQTVNKFVDTVKFTDFQIDGEASSQKKAFSSVVLQSFSIGVAGGNTQRSFTYEIDFVYDESIFKNTAVDGNAVANSVKLIVPKIITTRSETQKPSALFEQSTSGDSNGGVTR